MPDDKKDRADDEKDRMEDEKSGGILGFFDLMRKSAEETSSG